MTQLFTLERILEQIVLALGDDGQVYARFTWNNEPVTYALSSTEFMAWLAEEAVHGLCNIPGKMVLTQSIKKLERQARLKNFPLPVVNRIQPAHDRVFVRFGKGNEKTITASGLGSSQQAAIYPTRLGQIDIPAAEEGDVLALLAKVSGLDNAQCLQVLPFLMGPFQPRGHCPVLIVTGGSEGAGTSVAVALRQTLDPSTQPLSPLPHAPAALVDIMEENAVLAFDYVGHISNKMVEQIVTLSRGVPYQAPDGRSWIRQRVPIILVCSDLPRDAGLLSQSIVLRLGDSCPRPKQGDGPSHLDARAQLFHSLTGVYARALDELLALEGGDGAPSACWALALDRALQLKGALIEAANANAQATMGEWVDSVPGLRALREFVKSEGHVALTASQILSEIESFADGPKSHLPVSAREFAHLLRRSQPYIQDIEMKFDTRRGHGRDRIIALSWKGQQTNTATKPPRTAGSRSRPQTEPHGPHQQLLI